MMTPSVEPNYDGAMRTGSLQRAVIPMSVEHQILQYDVMLYSGGIVLSIIHTIYLTWKYARGPMN